MWKIPLFKMDLGEAEREAVLRPVRDDWLTLGPVTREFEDRFAELVGAGHAVAVANCTAALHLALAAHDVGPGHEVITPALTFVATANAVRHCGARVVFADCVGEEDLTVDPEDVRRKVTPRTRALMVVHYAGFPAAMEELGALAREHDLVLVEDSAHALVTRVDGRALGTLGDCGCFSFFSNKNMTCGEGGMVTTEDGETAERLRRLRSHGMTTFTLDRDRGRAWSYDCVETGWNYRIDEIRASLALAQLQRLPEFLEGRRRVRAGYLEALDGLPVVVPFTRWDGREDASIAYHIMPVVLPRSADREKVMEHLKSRGIQSSIHYPPAHRFRAARLEGHEALPVTEDLARRELTLPFFPTMTRDEVEAVCRALGEALR